MYILLNIYVKYIDKLVNTLLIYIKYGSIYHNNSVYRYININDEHNLYTEI